MESVRQTRSRRPPGKEKARPSRRALGITAALLLAGFTSLYAEEIRRTFATSDSPTVEVRTQNGKVKVKGWDQNQIGVVGRTASDDMKMTVDGNTQKVTVETHPTREKLSREESLVNLEIQVPRKSTVHVKSDRGLVEVDDIEDGEVMVDGVSTDVDVADVRGNIDLKTVDGPIQLISSQGRIRVESISGDMKFMGVSGSEVMANTNSGSISFEGDFGAGNGSNRTDGMRGGNYVLNSYSSSIEVIAARTASFHLSARSVQGLIQNNLMIRPTADGNAFRRLPGRYVEGRFNAGDAILEVNSFSGTIRLNGSGR